MRKLLVVTASLFCLAMHPASALGQDGASPPPPPPAVASDVQHQVSVTFAPILAMGSSTTQIQSIRVLELLGEYAVTRKVSAAAILAFGKVTMKDPTYDPANIYEVGAQGRFYPLGTFIHGMNVGAEVLWTKADITAKSGNVSAAATASGLAVAPFVGYKIATNIGFTFDAHLGVRYYALQANATASTGDTASAKQSDSAPLLRLNIGWSF